jgi:hypothetical protein
MDAFSPSLLQAAELMGGQQPAPGTMMLETSLTRSVFTEPKAQHIQQQWVHYISFLCMT